MNHVTSDQYQRLRTLFGFDIGVELCPDCDCGADAVFSVRLQHNWQAPSRPDFTTTNALSFIDKYVQVAQILGPLVNTLNQIDKACEEDTGLRAYMEAYGGVEKAKRDVLRDFFTHAFDGSGGNNDFDAGSCIDGRLTSAWNWCSQIADKPFYPLFRMTGFMSFSGEFGER